MRRLMILALVFALLDVSSLLAGPAGQAPAASIAGIAKSSSGQPIANATVRLRSLTSGRPSVSTPSGPTGQFNFAGLDPGNYVVEIVNEAGQIVGVSSPISVVAGSAVTGVTVTAGAVAIAAVPAAAAIGAASASGIGPAALVVTVASAAGVAGVLRATTEASKSR